MVPSSEEAGPFDPDRPIIRDKRRIDPLTGERRPGTASVAPGSAFGPGAAQPVPQTLAMPPELADLENQLLERTSDLQRVKAEYDNYRRRVERDRLAVAEQALASVLLGLLPVLDDIGRARDHGEVAGGFKSVAESLEATTTKLGLQAYGEVGEPFDPVIHEALMHSYSTEVSEPTCVSVLQPGYRLGERVLRPARVAVAEPAPEPESAPQPAPVATEVLADQAEAEPGAPTQVSPEAPNEYA
jgi:molecular chaperone GrpE